MKIKFVLISFCFVCFFSLFANATIEERNDSISVELKYTEVLPMKIEIKAFEPVILDSMLFVHNPLFSELVFMGVDIHLDWRENQINTLFYGQNPRTLNQPFEPIERQSPVEILTQLRNDTRRHITQTAPRLYRTTIDRLPQINWEEQRGQTVEMTPIELLILDEGFFTPAVSQNRLAVQKRRISPWQNRANAMLQFSQNSFSENWHLGGNNFFSLLGVVSGHFNYDNRKSVKWDNSYEWRTGFNTVTGDPMLYITNGDTIRNPGRRAMPSDDILRINSTFSVRATGAFYYNASMKFETHFFDNPRALNSLEMRARFLTPIRFNAGIGMEYRVSNIRDNRINNVSVTLSPLSFRLIHLTDTARTANGFWINTKAFGIEEGNQLQEFGSELAIRLTDYRPIPQLRITSRFSFFTNYEKVVIDWDTTAELSFSRFFSARLMVNPRFDNTAILDKDDKAKIQMRQMLTVGFSYRFL
jgi:hypothetical protein